MINLSRISTTLLTLLGGIKVVEKEEADGVVLYTARGNCLTPPNIYRFVKKMVNQQGERLYWYQTFNLRDRFGNHLYEVDRRSYWVKHQRDLSSYEVNAYAAENGFV